MTNRRNFFALISAALAAPAVAKQLQPAQDLVTAYAYRESGHTFYALQSPDHSITVEELITQAMYSAGMLMVGQAPSAILAEFGIFHLRLLLLCASQPDRPLSFHGIVPVSAREMLSLHNALTNRLRRAYMAL